MAYLAEVLAAVPQKVLSLQQSTLPRFPHFPTYRKSIAKFTG
jgi:hypothetical protein